MLSTSAVRTGSPCPDIFCSRAKCLLKQTRGEETTHPDKGLGEGPWQGPGRTPFMLLPISTFMGNALHAFLGMENSRVQMCTRSSFQEVLSSLLTVTQRKSMHLETRVVFFRCSSYIFTSSVQLSSASSSLAQNL